MSIVPFAALTCPLDGHPLTRGAQAWRCPEGHSFDIAKQGHTNLLPVQHKRSRDPGDSKFMVQARRAFLNAGFYQPLADKLNQMMLAHVANDEPAACLDAGCGEGHYLRQLAHTAGTQNKPLSLLGVDVSKWAVLSAAKQDKPKQATWVVGTNAKLPVPDASLDHIMCLFGFPVYGEFLRALKPGGHLWLAEAGSQHLQQLKAIIYPSIKPNETKPPNTPDEFHSLEREHVCFDFSLTQPADIANLMAMTPHQHRATHEGKQALSALTQLTLTADVWLHGFQKA